MFVLPTGFFAGLASVCFRLNEEEPETKYNAYYNPNYITKMVKNDMERGCIKMAQLVGLTISQLGIIAMGIVTIVCVNSGTSSKTK